MSLIEIAEALVLRRSPYKEKGQVVTIFSPQKGKLTFLSWKSDHKNALLLTPLSLGEYILKSGRGALPSFIDGTLLYSFPKNRSSWKHLETSGHILRSLLLSQMPEKPSEKLFSLTKWYLKKMEKSPYPESFGASFLVKLLKYEGFLPPPHLNFLGDIKKFSDLNASLINAQDTKTLQNALKEQLKA